MLQRSWTLGLAVVWIVAGCGDDDAGGKDTTTTATDTSQGTDTTTGDTAVAPDGDAASETSAPDTVGEDTADGAGDTGTSADTSPNDDTGDDTSEPPRRVYDPIPGRWSEDFAFSLPGLQAELGPRAYDMIREPVSGKVIVGGIFDRIGDLEVAHIASWSSEDGFAALGDGPGITVHALAADGAGAVYAGGRAPSGGLGIPGPGPVNKWDGLGWTPVGWTDAYSPVWAVAWIDGELWIGGEFTAVQSADFESSVETAYLARFDGTTWHAVPGGPDGVVHTIVQHGDEVCVGGNFTTPGANVACLGEGGWRALGEGLNSSVHVLHSEDATSLVAGGYFSFGDPLGPPEQFFVGLARFTTASGEWAPVAGGVLNGYITNVWELAPTGDGGLYVGGNFKQVNAVSPRYSENLARLDGATWTVMGPVTNELGVTLASEVGPRAVLADGDGILVAGLFSTVDGVTALNIARHDEGAWSALVEVEGPNLGIAGNVNSLSYGPDGSLYVGGYFTSAGGVTTPNVARFGAGQGIVPIPAPPGWHSLGEGLDDTVWVVHATAAGKLYAGGLFSGGFARWSGTTWERPGVMDGDVRAIADDGPDVYVGGTFTTIGVADIARVARFTGQTFQPLGPGLNDRVNAVLVAPDGSVYAGGFFRGTGDYDAEKETGVALDYIARWNGASWEDVGGGLDGFVRDLAWWGDDLVVVGQFSKAGGAVVSSIARWDGEAWSAIGKGDEWLYPWGGAMQLGALAAQHNGLFVAGAFTDHMIGEDTHNGVAWWDGTSFVPLGTGPNDLVEDVVITPDGRGAFIGGPFLRVGGNPSLGLALWEFDDTVGTEVVEP